MTSSKPLTLDANILLRAVWGSRTRSLIETYEDAVEFCAPEVCFNDARKYIPEIAARRGADPTYGFEVLEDLRKLIRVVEYSDYREFETRAHPRIRSRDINDWPIVATALLFDCPIWTEDRDFFGCGIATWTTETVEIYLRGEHASRRP